MITTSPCSVIGLDAVSGQAVVRCAIRHGCDEVTSRLGSVGFSFVRFITTEYSKKHEKGEQRKLTHHEGLFDDALVFEFWIMAKIDQEAKFQ